MFSYTGIPIMLSKCLKKLLTVAKSNRASEKHLINMRLEQINGAGRHLELKKSLLKNFWGLFTKMFSGHPSNFPEKFSFLHFLSMLKSNALELLTKDYT